MTGYVHRVMAACTCGTLGRKAVWSVNIVHDDSCAYRAGECTCVPDITARNITTGKVVEIGLDGEAMTSGDAQ